MTYTVCLVKFDVLLRVPAMILQFDENMEGQNMLFPIST